MGQDPGLLGSVTLTCLPVNQSLVRGKVSRVVMAEQCEKLWGLGVGGPRGVGCRAVVLTVGTGKRAGSSKECFPL